MREIFPEKQSGDRLSAQHINDLSRVARALTSGGNGSFGSGVQYSGQQTSQPFPFWVQDNFVITSIGSSDTYLMKYRYYDHDAGQWQTDQERNEVELDASDRDVTYKAGDKTNAYWDEQRNAWIPLGTAGSKEDADDKMWCAELCDCALDDGGGTAAVCCIYRGRVKRAKGPDDEDINDGGPDAEGDYNGGEACKPPKTLKPAFILTSCNVTVPAEGWVRFVQEEFTLTWTPTGSPEPITETLELYEWCCWPPPGCPDDDEEITATFSARDPACDDKMKDKDGDRLAVNMEFREKTNPPTDEEPCDNDVRTTGHPDGGGWVGEFSIEVEQEIRVFEVDWVSTGGSDEGENDVGYVQPNPLTGELVALWIPNPDGNELIKRFGSYNIREYIGACRPLVNEDGEPITETVVRHYRVNVQCDAAKPKNACVQHLYPPGHPVYAMDVANLQTPADLWAIPDAGAVADITKVCDNDFIGFFDYQFGDAHQDPAVFTGAGFSYPTYSGSPPGLHPLDKWFGGAQFSTHIFYGCFTSIGADCRIDDPNADTGRVTIHFVWE